MRRTRTSAPSADLPPPAQLITDAIIATLESGTRLPEETLDRNGAPATVTLLRDALSWREYLLAVAGCGHAGLRIALLDDIQA